MTQCYDIGVNLWTAARSATKATESSAEVKEDQEIAAARKYSLPFISTYRDAVFSSVHNTEFRLVRICSSRLVEAASEPETTSLERKSLELLVILGSRAQTNMVETEDKGITGDLLIVGVSLPLIHCQIDSCVDSISIKQ